MRAASKTLALTATAASLIAGFALKSQCLWGPWGGKEYLTLCYNDIQPLFHARGVDSGLLPYIEARYEYPVLTGWFMDLMGRIQRLLVDVGLFESASNVNYFLVTALFLAPFAFLVTALLRPRVPQSRLLIWAAGSPLVLYAFHNWDLIAVAFAVWGLVQWEDARRSAGASILAVGASAKLYPAYFFPGMFLDSWGRGHRREALKLAAWFLGVFLLINLPVIVAARGIPPILTDPNWGEIVRDVNALRNPEVNGWLEIWRFHAGRFPDFGTVWFWIARHGDFLVPSDFWAVRPAGQASGFQVLVDVVSFGAMALGSLALLWRGWRRMKNEGDFPVMATGLGVIALFLLVSKVHSPQFALWVAPMLALLSVPWRWVIGYFAADLLLFVSGFYYFYFGLFGHGTSGPIWYNLFELAVIARAVMLALILRASLSATRETPTPADPKEAEPALAG